MAYFRPQANGYITKFGKETLVSEFSETTYRKVLSAVKSELIKRTAEFVYIYRSRRGEWGEWVELWRLVNNRPTKIKEFWS